MGGKYRLAPSIVKLLPPHRIYVEVFGGAASVLLAKEPSQIEVYNDRDGAIVNLFETLRNHPLLFLEKCDFLLYSRDLYHRWGPQLRENFQGQDVDNVEAAVRTCYSITSGFIGDPTKGWAFDRSGAAGGSGRWSNIWERVRFLSERLRSVNIDCLDFRKCIKNWDTEETLFFLDPPYVNTGGQSYYSFISQDHEDLANLLHNVKGKWLLIYNDDPQVRELYKGFHVSSIDSKLNAQKISQGGTRTLMKQILISNYLVE